MCEEGKISKHINNILRKLMWHCDPEPVAIGFRVALNPSAYSCHSIIILRLEQNIIPKYTELTVTGLSIPKNIQVII